MKPILLLCLIALTSCASLQVPNPQNWNSDELLQRMYAKEENERIQRHAQRVMIIQDSIITIMELP